MLKYLIVVLDDTSVSYCHYDNLRKTKKLISLHDLKEGIFFGMKENLMIQFVYPEYQLPQEYLDLIDSVDHGDIKASGRDVRDADVVVLKSWESVADCTLDSSGTYILRICKDELMKFQTEIPLIFGKVKRLNIIVTDIYSFSEEELSAYGKILKKWTQVIGDMLIFGRDVQVNLITDRVNLNAMNNCGAGDTSITLAPDGRFYVCPGFYPLGDALGSVSQGLSIANGRLYKIVGAPICRRCDAFHCKRCIWMNKKTTLEVNTPGHEQCVAAHLEREASRMLLERIQEECKAFLDRKINELEYVDPFETFMNN